LRNLRTIIASSTDKQKLVNLVHHKNFHVALASWYALSKLAPKEVAYEIITDAIVRSEALNYSYVVGGDQIFSEELSAGHAAYDLFSETINPTGKYRSSVSSYLLLARHQHEGLVTLYQMLIT